MNLIQVGSAGPSVIGLIRLSVQVQQIVPKASQKSGTDLTVACRPARSCGWGCGWGGWSLPEPGAVGSS